MAGLSDLADLAMIAVRVEDEGRYTMIHRPLPKRELLSTRYGSPSRDPAPPQALGSWTRLAEQESIGIGDRVIVIGHPGAAGGRVLSWSLTEGTVSRMLDEAHLQVNVATNPGNSGGPIVDLRSRVVGVVVGAYYRAGSTDQVLQGLTIGVTGTVVTDFIEAARLAPE